MEVWRAIDEFPGYSVSDCGRVRNDENGRIMAILMNQHGVANVGLTKGRVQYKRSVALLVATAFMTPHPQEKFDTPINLDGDRLNNNVENLLWRPRWFAVRYHNQFESPVCGIRQPLQDSKTKEVYDSSWHAAISCGLLDRDIYLSILNRTYVWPTYQFFEFARTGADII